MRVRFVISLLVHIVLRIVCKRRAISYASPPDERVLHSHSRETRALRDRDTHSRARSTASRVVAQQHQHRQSRANTCAMMMSSSSLYDAPPLIMHTHDILSPIFCIAIIPSLYAFHFNSIVTHSRNNGTSRRHDHHIHLCHHQTDARG